MQQITITRNLLKQFSTEYVRVPDVGISNPYGVKSEFILIVAWLISMSTDPEGQGSTAMSSAFNGWLCGRGEFCLLEEEQPAFEVHMKSLFEEALPNGTNQA